MSWRAPFRWSPERGWWSAVARRCARSGGAADPGRLSRWPPCCRPTRSLRGVAADPGREARTIEVLPRLPRGRARCVSGRRPGRRGAGNRGGRRAAALAALPRCACRTALAGGVAADPGREARAVEVVAECRPPRAAAVAAGEPASCSWAATPTTSARCRGCGAADRPIPDSLAGLPRPESVFLGAARRRAVPGFARCRFRGENSVLRRIPSVRRVLAVHALSQLRRSFVTKFTRSDHYQWALWLLVTGA